jgi:hypothetical protein
MTSNTKEGHLLFYIQDQVERLVYYTTMKSLLYSHLIFHLYCVRVSTFFYERFLGPRGRCRVDDGYRVNSRGCLVVLPLFAH